MRPFIILFCVTILAACSSTQQISEDLQLPELIHQTPLPDFPKRIIAPNLRIDLEILVAEDGTVHYVNLDNDYGEPAWDSGVVAAIRQWKYTPARYKGTPIRLWLHQSAIIQFSSPHLLSLAEIVCTTKEEADSVYALLKEGCKFCDAAKRYSVSNSRSNDGVLGEVNIHSYPKYIQNILEKLDEGTFTEPLKYESKYIIFFRMKISRDKASME